MPIAWHGEIGEYADEAEEQLRLKVGQGITGWVAEHGLAQYLPDADGDPRTQTIAGTQEHLDESLLVAPMKFEDRVLGVIVLSKLGLHQFSSDDLRLLEIYGSLAAQAVRTAVATEGLHAQSAALERRVRSQQELLSLTEAIITTLEQSTLLDLVAERVPRSSRSTPSPSTCTIRSVTSSARSSRVASMPSTTSSASSSRTRTASPGGSSSTARRSSSSTSWSTRASAVSVSDRSRDRSSSPRCGTAGRSWAC